MRLLLFLVAPSLLFAFNIEVKLVNGTTGKPATVERLDLIKLEQGMQVEKSLKGVRSRASFTGLAAPTTAPYMVQAEFKGARYSKVIPPMMPSPARVELLVYDTTSSFSDKIRYRVLYHVERVADELQVVSVHHFENNTKRTFQEKEGGIYVTLPEGTTSANGSVSVGSGKSDVQWLRLAPQPSEKYKGRYLLAHPLKPGRKVYQVEYTIPYKGDRAQIAFADFYRREIPIQLIVETKDMDLSIKEKPAWKAERTFAQELKKEMVELPPVGKGLTLLFSGGTPSPRKVPVAQSGQIQVGAPLSVAEKIALPLGSVVLFLGLYAFLLKSHVLRGWHLRQLARLRFEREQLKGRSDLRQSDERRLEVLEQRIKKYDEYTQL